MFTRAMEQIKSGASRIAIKQALRDEIKAAEDADLDAEIDALEAEVAEQETASQAQGIVVFEQ